MRRIVMIKTLNFVNHIITDSGDGVDNRETIYLLANWPTVNSIQWIRATSEKMLIIIIVNEEKQHQIECSNENDSQRALCNRQSLGCAHQAASKQRKNNIIPYIIISYERSTQKQKLTDTKMPNAKTTTFAASCGRDSTTVFVILLIFCMFQWPAYLDQKHHINTHTHTHRHKWSCRCAHTQPLCGAWNKSKPIKTNRHIKKPI